MPIRLERKHFYPKNWKEIREQVMECAGGRCEGSSAYPDCRAENDKPHPVTNSKVILTTAHLNHKKAGGDFFEIQALSRFEEEKWLHAIKSVKYEGVLYAKILGMNEVERGFVS